MDSWRLAFRNLTFNTKFDFKRFRCDAEKLKIIKPKAEAESANEHSGSAAKQKRPSSDTNSSKAAKRRKLEVEEDASEEDVDSEVETGKLRNSNDNDSVEDSELGNDSKDDEDYGSDDVDMSGDEGDSDGDEDDVDEETDEDSEDEDSESSSEGEANDEKPKEDGAQRPFDSSESKGLTEKKRKKGDKSRAKLAQLKQEQVNHARNVHHMQVLGEDIPDPVVAFEQLVEDYEINPKILSNLKAMGFTTPTGIETQAIPVMLNRREIMACAPTGSGKTLAFVLPVLHHLKEPTNKPNNIRALVLAPTIELAKQINREFERIGAGLGFRIQFIENVAKELKRASEKPRKVDILVTTPNRLVYLMKDLTAFSLSSIEWLIIDECDKLFEDGTSGFREQLGNIYKACNSKDVRRGLFSATFANDVKEWCLLNLDNVVQVYIGARNATTRLIKQELIYTESEDGKLIALRQLIQKGFQPPVLIFVQSKERARDLFLELCHDKLNVEVIHGDKTQAQRDKIVTDFRTGKIWMLICTEVMGRGIDFKGVNLVINYDFPNSAVSYIHRIGRTGRAGRQGRAITFFATADAKYLKSIVNVMREAGCEVPDYMLQLKKPSKSKMKQLAKSAIKREPISLMRHNQEELKKIRKKKKSGDQPTSTDTN